MCTTQEVSPEMFNLVRKVWKQASKIPKKAYCRVLGWGGFLWVRYPCTQEVSPEMFNPVRPV